MVMMNIFLCFKKMILIIFDQNSILSPIQETRQI
jgi:hypothetical protein